VIAPAHDREVRRDCARGRGRRIKLKLPPEVERLKLAASYSGHDLGDRTGAEHYVDAEFPAHPLAFGQLRQATHQAYGQTPALLLFAQLAEQRLGLLDGLAAHRAGVYQHEVRFAEIVYERVPDAGKLRLYGVSVILVHLAAECHYVRSHKISGSSSVAMSSGQNRVALSKERF
jgi:hypothetical protein